CITTVSIASQYSLYSNKVLSSQAASTNFFNSAIIFYFFDKINEFYVLNYVFLGIYLFLCQNRRNYVLINTSGQSAYLKRGHLQLRRVKRGGLSLKVRMLNHRQLLNQAMYTRFRKG